MNGMTLEHRTRKVVTSGLSFFPCNRAQVNLFSVQAGVPVVDALETASAFLGVALDAVRKAADSSDFNSANAADYLITMAKAVIDSIERGAIGRATVGVSGKTADDSLSRNVFERLHALHENGALIINPAAVKHESDDARSFLDWVGVQVKGGAQ